VICKADNKSSVSAKLVLCSEENCLVELEFWSTAAIQLKLQLSKKLFFTCLLQGPQNALGCGVQLLSFKHAIIDLKLYCPLTTIEKRTCINDLCNLCVPIKAKAQSAVSD